MNGISLEKIAFEFLLASFILILAVGIYIVALWLMRARGKGELICPKLDCDAEMEGDSDGYWCPKCEEYYPPDIIEEWLMENV